MYKRIAVLAAISAIIFAAHPSQAQSASTPLGYNSVRSFLPVYTHYAAAIQKHGLEGFKSVIISGFVIRNGHDQWAGAAALSQAHWRLDGIQGGKVAVTIRRLTMTGNQAVALTQENLTYHLGLNATGTGTAYLRQTWRRTGNRWKLAGEEFVSENILSSPPLLEYTVSADGGPAQTMFKEFITGPGTP